MAVIIAPIYEGHGEVAAARILLDRIWYDLLQCVEPLRVLSPVRQPQGRLRDERGLQAAVDYAAATIAQSAGGGDRSVVLMLLDAEREGCPKVLAQTLLGWARQAASHRDFACVIANPMFETWFVAAASSLAGVCGLPIKLDVPVDPEANRLGKVWIDQQMRSVKRNKRYREKVDQPSLAARFDLQLCRANSPSFDKLCRELERLAATVSSP